MEVILPRGRPDTRWVCSVNGLKRSWMLSRLLIVPRVLAAIVDITEWSRWEKAETIGRNGRALLICLSLLPSKPLLFESLNLSPLLERKDSPQGGRLVQFRSSLNRLPGLACFRRTQLGKHRSDLNGEDWGYDRHWSLAGVF